MRKRIRAIADGKFDYKEMDVSVSTERIEHMAKKDEKLHGSLVLESRDERKLKGLIYTTDRRMVCSEVQFQGRKVRIVYEFHTTGMQEGDTNKGEIYIESNAGEIIVPYVVSIEHRSIDTSIGKIRDLFHFANLAQKSYQEAYRLFCSGRFLSIGMDAAQRQLYRALTQSNVCRENMEEFLIAIHKKQPIYFTLSADEESYKCEGDSFKKEVTLSKNAWGYFSIQISADADFIYVEKPTVTSEDFVGNHYNWEFIVERKKLHAGKNTAVITFSSGIQTETLKIEIGLPGKKNKSRMKEKELLSEVCQLYIQVRNHTIRDAVWLKEALFRAEHLSSICPEEPFYQLFQAHMYTMTQQKTQAQWIINKFEPVFAWKKKNTALYAYIQYISALIKKDEMFTQIVTREIVQLCGDYPHDFALLRIRLFLDETLENNKVMKYRLLKEQYGYGCRSPFLYLEAGRLIKKDLSLLNRLEDFEQRILLFACKNGMLEEELVKKTADLALRLKEFSPFMFRFLTGAYEMFPSAAVVEAVCSMLIWANKRQSAYFFWFERGVEAELKITQLFEYYMYTVPSDYNRMFPKTLFLYFNFDNTLDYKRKACLYANLWRNREQLEELAAGYEPRIKLFLTEQIRQRHINENLAYLYRQMSADILSDPETAAIFEELVFVKKLLCENGNIRQVVVRHKELEREEIFPVVDKKAWVKLYGPEALVLLEDKSGRRHFDTISYELKPLIPDTDIAKYCLKFEKKKLGLLLNRYYKKGAVLKEGTCEICEKLLAKQSLCLEFRQELLKQLVEYYMSVHQYDKVEEHLFDLDYAGMDSRERAHFIEMLIIRTKYEKAYELVLAYGPEEVNPKRLVRLCSRLIVEDEPQEALLELCFYVFTKGKYDENILEYLTRYFYGPTWQMDRLWRAARQFDVETYGISERILMQMLFTGYLLPDSKEVFEDYYKPGYKPDVVRAYLAFFAYYYVVHEQIIDERIFSWIEQQYVQGETVNRDCKMALLKYYAGMVSVPDEKVPFLQEIMREFVEQHIVFPFFTQMDQKVSKKFHLHERSIIEHRAAPEKKVYIYYLLSEHTDAGEDYMQEELECIYDSIFVKELITFFGERVQYYIVECNADGSDWHIITSAVLDRSQENLENGEGRFMMLNEIGESYALKDEETLLEWMERYARFDHFTQNLFQIEAEK